MTKVKLTGHKPLIKKLADTDRLYGLLNKAMQKSNIVIQARAQKYPPQRPGSWYVRTRRLGNSWDLNIDQFSGGVRGFVNNPVEYAPDVMGPGTQAEVHKGVWVTTKMILREKKKQIVGFFEWALSSWNKGG